MKTRTSSLIWLTSFAAVVVLYAFATAPAWILMRDSDSVFAKIAQRMYSPVYLARQHSELVDGFYQQQWDYWFPILGCDSTSQRSIMHRSALSVRKTKQLSTEL
jgi:hypothetical protein